MHLHLVRHLWGNPLSPVAAIKDAAARGYRAVEAPLSSFGEPHQAQAALKEHGLTAIGQSFTRGTDEQAHFDSLRQQVDEFVAFGGVMMVTHSGHDGWSRQQAVNFYGRVVDWEKSCPIPIAHETHRGRVFFNPWATRDVLLEVPAVRLCCDFSHWVCIAERLLEDCGDIIELAARHCIHVHARVGFPEGPQVPDPSAPEYASALAAHEGWWNVIWRTAAARGDAALTITPEFGPPGYLHTLPHTNVPVADLTQVVEWMANRLRTTTFKEVDRAGRS